MYEGPFKYLSGCQTVTTACQTVTIAQTVTTALTVTAQSI